MSSTVIRHERLGRSADEIGTERGRWLGDVYAALAHYDDHREAIDAAIRADGAFVTEQRQREPSKVAVTGEV
jgi:hypothetical protein